MPYLDLLAYLFGGAFFTNAIPHFTKGVTGLPFQSPFSRPPGKGLSSAMVNVVWGFINIVIFYLLVCRVGEFDLRNSLDALVFGIGMLGMAMFLASQFGPLHGGDHPADGVRPS